VSADGAARLSNPEPGSVIFLNAGPPRIGYHAARHPSSDDSLEAIAMMPVFPARRWRAHRGHRGGGAVNPARLTLGNDGGDGHRKVMLFT